MKKTLKIAFIITILIIGGVFLIIYSNSNKKINFPDFSQLTDGQTFYAEIKKVNNKTFLVEGLSVNDINYRGEFTFSVDDSTILEWRNTIIEISDLEKGDNVSITFKGDVLETYPVKLTKVTKIQLLDDEK